MLSEKSGNYWAIPFLESPFRAFFLFGVCVCVYVFAGIYTCTAT